MLAAAPRLVPAQTAPPLEGQVLNARTGQPVPFATLGVPRRGLGTVADEQGRYLLRLPAGSADTLIVTSVGFAREVVLPAALAAGQRVFRLTPQEQAIANVVIAHRRVRPAVLGRRQSQGDLRWLAGSSGKSTVDDEWGWELGTVLSPARPARLEEFHVYLADNQYEHLRFRLNLYALDNGRPGPPLLSQDIQLTARPRQKGWLSVDLRPYQLTFDARPVVATIQWLQSEKTQPEKKYFAIPVKRQPRHTMVERENSQALWTLHPMQPSLYFDLLME
ncbi:carboxypeptidase-like regulatory domain-containing protein [Hymenobacter sp. B81]|uniref:carboxypeptidase-like regulatory domain-containing protein n=1 Tax=Hymenobacter sp. B81 TaxID=3344878 RepID=UPI0037DD8532